MIKLTNIPQLLQAFDIALNQNKIKDSFKPFYIKWLRFYLDFCQKYGHVSDNPASLPLFIQKLTLKKQPAAFLKQADHAINIYYQMMQQQMKNNPSSRMRNENKITIRSTQVANAETYKPLLTRQLNIHKLMGISYF